MNDTVKNQKRNAVAGASEPANSGVMSLHRYLCRSIGCRSIGCRFLTQSGWLCRRHEGLVR